MKKISQLADSTLGVVRGNYRATGDWPWWRMCYIRHFCNGKHSKQGLWVNNLLFPGMTCLMAPVNALSVDFRMTREESLYEGLYIQLACGHVCVLIELIDMGRRPKPLWSAPSLGQGVLNCESGEIQRRASNWASAHIHLSLLLTATTVQPATSAFWTRDFPEVIRWNL